MSAVEAEHGVARAEAALRRPAPVEARAAVERVEVRGARAPASIQTQAPEQLLDNSPSAVFPDGPLDSGEEEATAPAGRARAAMSWRRTPAAGRSSRRAAWSRVGRTLPSSVTIIGGVRASSSILSLVTGSIGSLVDLRAGCPDARPARPHRQVIQVEADVAARRLFVRGQPLKLPAREEAPSTMFILAFVAQVRFAVLILSFIAPAAVRPGYPMPALPPRLRAVGVRFPSTEGSVLVRASTADHGSYMLVGSSAMGLIFVCHLSTIYHWGAFERTARNVFCRVCSRGTGAPLLTPWRLYSPSRFAKLSARDDDGIYTGARDDEIFRLLVRPLL